ncbi:hypothetical protein AC579_9608 [Pseudocercospora musae]|uniref:CBM1 domain-containing protein n=1 Tax=Pseudocercospora musae TaxID=113226 RepID=A0A139ITD5_9PEZI|nr:hypothetical protein AC579_9608 [Pseudocercospora musae]
MSYFLQIQAQTRIHIMRFSILSVLYLASNAAAYYNCELPTDVQPYGTCVGNGGDAGSYTCTPEMDVNRSTSVLRIVRREEA